MGQIADNQSQGLVGRPAPGDEIQSRLQRTQIGGIGVCDDGTSIKTFTHIKTCSDMSERRGLGDKRGNPITACNKECQCGAKILHISFSRGRKIYDSLFHTLFFRPEEDRD